MNEKGKSASISSVAVPRYELIDKDGRSIATNANAEYLGELAGRLWPDQQQDEDRTGKGWDVQVMGAE